MSAALAAGEGRVAVCSVRSTAASMSFCVSALAPGRGAQKAPPAAMAMQPTVSSAKARRPGCQRARGGGVCTASASATAAASAGDPAAGAAAGGSVRGERL
ncbi:hypothetical protein D3C72_1290340 [compost metagenome]